MFLVKFLGISCRRYLFHVVTNFYPTFEFANELAISRCSLEVFFVESMNIYVITLGAINIYYVGANNLLLVSCYDFLYGALFINLSYSGVSYVFSIFSFF